MTATVTSESGFAEKIWTEVPVRVASAVAEIGPLGGLPTVARAEQAVCEPP